MILFREEYGDKIRPIKTIMNIDLFEYGDFLDFKQVPIWIFAMLWINSRYYDEIHVGYVMGDDAIGYIDDIEYIYYSFNKIMSEQIPIKFPLVKTQKSHIIRELPKKYTELTHSCENPYNVTKLKDGGYDYKMCGICPACTKIIHTDKFGFGLNDRELHLKEEIYERELRRVTERIKYPNGIISDKKIADGKQLKINFIYSDTPVETEYPISDLDVENIEVTREKIYKDAIAAIKEHELFFIEDVVSFLPISSETFYKWWPLKSEKSDNIKRLLEANKIAVKVELRKDFKNGASMEKIALYKILATKTELAALTNQPITLSNDKDDNTLNINIVRPKKD